MIIIVIFITGFAYPSLAAENDGLTWERAVNMLDSGNETIKKLAYSEQQASRQYVDAVISSKSINITGTNVTVMGHEVFINFNDYTKMLLTQQKELLPVQMLYSWDMVKSNKVITRNSLIIALRGIYAGLYSANSRFAMNSGKLKLAETMIKQAKIKYKDGLINDIDMEEAEYNLFKAQTEYNAALASLENTYRTYNAFAGIEITRKYGDISFTELYSPGRLKKLDDYIGSALKQRLEIVSTERQLAIAEQKKSILEKNQVHQIYTDVAKDYANLLLDMESLKIKHEEARLEVEKDIRNAYAEVISSGKNVENMNNTLKLQKKNLEKMRKRYDTGLISKNVLDQAELGYTEVELGYRMTLLDYNTKVIRLQSAASVGPAYGS
jgi:outer membrane protein TolC